MTKSTADGPSLLVEDREEVRWIMFNRPGVHNAQNVDMLTRLLRALDDAASASSIRAVVLGGIGPSFCSGHDLREMADNVDYARRSSTPEGRYWQELKLFVDPVIAFAELPLPTICRVQGHCIGAGLSFAASADLVVAASDARFSSPILHDLAVNDSEVPALTWALGERRAKQMLWLNETLDADVAMAMGMVNWVVDLEELDSKVESVVQQVLEIPREALALSKASFQFMAERRGQRDTYRFHYLSHQLSHHTTEARALQDRRLERARRGLSVIADR